MATTTKDTQQKDDAEFAAQFDKPDEAKKEPTEDEAFGLAEPEGGADDAGEGGGDAPDGGTDAPAGAAEGATTDTSSGDAAPAPGADEQRLKEWEARLQQQQAELDARDASTQSANVGESQSSAEGSPTEESGESADEEAAEESDPGKALADDFGPDFVDLLTRFVKQICKGEVGEGLGGVSATVDAVIKHLQTERQANHFKAIASAHSDFQEIVESPAFSAWKESQAPEEQTRLQHVIDSGSAEQIIEMLTAFKNSRSSGVDEGALDDAEGVRSGGMSLPSEPAASDDYAKAWDQA